MRELSAEEIPTDLKGPATKKYDFDMLLDGKARELEEGVDYTGKAASFRNRLYKEASQRGLSIRSWTTVETVDGVERRYINVLAVPADDPEADAPATSSDAVVADPEPAPEPAVEPVGGELEEDPTESTVSLAASPDGAPFEDLLADIG